MIFLIHTLAVLLLLCAQYTSSLLSLVPLKRMHNRLHMCNTAKPYTAIMVVPTGIGASIGGYAGDALPSARLLSTVVDTLITHPNVLNGAMLYWNMDNVLYVEGYALDEFAGGRVGLQRVLKRGNKIGVILDKGIEPSLRLRHLQVIDAYRATLGIDVQEVVVTSVDVGVETKVSSSGASWGTLVNPSTLVESATYLKSKGCTAVAVIVRFPEDEHDDAFDLYRQGEGVDAIAGVEAIISHIITQHTYLPTAHAPAFASMDVEEGVSPKACAEEIGYTFLPCVLSYLYKAPQLIQLVASNAVAPPIHTTITIDDVDAIVVPASAMGGSAVLSCLSRKKLVIVVDDNTTSMSCYDTSLTPSSSDSTNVSTSTSTSSSSSRSSSVSDDRSNIVHARSYAEAAGLLSAHKHGLLFQSLTPHVHSVPVTHL